MRRAAVALTLLLTLAGCGNRRAPDLFDVQRDGALPGARLELRVSDDGRVRCNGGEPRRLPDELLLDAREIARALDDLAPRALPSRPRSQLRYRVRAEGGTVSFADNSPGQEKAMSETQAFVRRVAREVCGLVR